MGIPVRGGSRTQGRFSKDNFKVKQESNSMLKGLNPTSGSTQFAVILLFKLVSRSAQEIVFVVAVFAKPAYCEGWRTLDIKKLK